MAGNSLVKQNGPIHLDLYVFQRSVELGRSLAFSIFSLPPIMRIRQSLSVTSVRLDFCMYGLCELGSGGPL